MKKDMVFKLIFLLILSIVMLASRNPYIWVPLAVLLPAFCFYFSNEKEELENE